jgi:gentisate 1,2-dioxygenase
MKAHFIEVGVINKESFSVKMLDVHHFNTPFHFHELCEMNYVIEGFGKTIVGDNISNFSSGDLVLMSANLPHIWYNDPSYFKETNNFPSAKAMVTYFDSNFLIALTNESQYGLKINSLLERAKRGIRFFGNTRKNNISKLIWISKKN